MSFYLDHGDDENPWKRQCTREKIVKLERELAALTTERDALKITLASADREIERLNLMVQMMDESKELPASQQEVSRLREALDNANEKIRVFAEKIRAFAKPAVQNLLAKMSTPSPDHKDTERLDWLQKSPFENLSAIRFTTQPCMKHHDVRAAIDAEIERTKGAK